MVVSVGDKTSVVSLNALDTTVSDTVSVATSDAVKVTLDSGLVRVTDADREDRQQVKISDSYQVVPYDKRITMDFQLPTYITEGLFVEVDELRDAILDEVHGREIAIIASENYAKTYTDGIEAQVYSNIDAAYISNEAGANYVLAAHLTDMELEFSTATGTTTATLQDIYTTTVNVGNAQAGYDEDLRLVVTDTTALANRSTVLDASVAGITASVTATEGVSVGTPTTWDGLSAVLIGQLYDFGNGEGVMQYLGGALGTNGNGWVNYSGTIFQQVATKFTTLEDSIGVSLDDLQNQVDGAITTWFIDGSPEYSTADAEYVAVAGTEQIVSLVANTTKVLVESTAVHSQMYLWVDAAADVDVGATDFSDNTLWLAIYKIPSCEADWLTADGVDVVNGYHWYSSENAILPLLDTNVPAIHDTRATRIGDLYYDRVTGYAYRYVYEDIADSPDLPAIFSWVMITDEGITKALENASLAQATADGKRAIFYSDTIPTTTSSGGLLGDGDMWIPSANVAENGTTYLVGDTYIYNTTADTWNPITRSVGNQFADDILSGVEKISLTDQVEDDIGWGDSITGHSTALGNFTAAIYAQDMLDVGTQTDGVAVTYFQDTEPYSATDGTSENTGDTWLKTTDNSAYRFKYAITNSIETTQAEWVQVTNQVIVDALVEAERLNAAADRSIKNYTVEPTTPYYEGDTWMQGSTGDIKVCDVERLTGDFVAADWITASRYTDDTAANRTVKLFSDVEASPPVAEGIGDIWTVTNVYYDDDTNYPQVRIWDGTAWNAVATKAEVDELNIQWAGGSSKLLTAPNGAITGWSFGAGSDAESQFKISADTFSLVNADGSATPLVIDASDPNNVGMTFTGKVDFANSATDMSDYANSNVDLSDLALLNMSNVTTIDGGKITTGALFSKDINFTGKITGGSGGLGGIIQSANYVDGVSGMKIDLVNGSIYIA